MGPVFRCGRSCWLQCYQPQRTSLTSAPNGHYVIATACKVGDGWTFRVLYIFLRMQPPLPYSTVLLLTLLPATVSSSCHPELQFQCEDGSCIPITDICSGGLKGCPPGDISDSTLSLCSNCSAPHLIHCKLLGQDVCVHTIFQCSPGMECPPNESYSESSMCEPPCDSDMFECHDATRCIHSEGVCNGVPQCDDWSDQLADQCDLCQDPQLFKCFKGDHNVCINRRFLCDGLPQCDDWSDELASQCGLCQDSRLFRCFRGGQDVCMHKRYMCDGVWHCDDRSDELALQCDGCQDPQLFKCFKGDQDVCINRQFLCDGFPQCDDWSDELASQCGLCQGPQLFRCGVGGQDVCIHKRFMCDGVWSCDDRSDELAVQCDFCLDPQLFMCVKDGLEVCIDMKYMCDGVWHCDDMSDELAAQCDLCQDPQLFKCVRDGQDVCITTGEVCDGKIQCSDNTDESVELCPCTDPDKFTCTRQGVEVCLNKTYQCDGLILCDNSTDELRELCTCSNPTMFTCTVLGVEVCLSREFQCDGILDCSDYSDESLELCPCTDPTKFTCTSVGVELCLSRKKYECDGFRHCDDSKDELLELCPCTDPSMFTCTRLGVEVCLSIERNKCDGTPDCDDRLDELASQCDWCQDPQLFRCVRDGQDVCIKSSSICDGIPDCENADESLDICPCTDPAMFTCLNDGVKVCRSIRKYRCNGRRDCDDTSDESPLVCNGCNMTGLASCKDGSKCIPSLRNCNGLLDCSDGSDESEWAGCSYCNEAGAVPCPGFPGSCAQVCDGNSTCPDMWDEQIATCEAHNVSCTGYACKDGSRCISSDEVCDSKLDCNSGEDENEHQCEMKRQLFQYERFSLHFCGDGGFIHRPMVCSSSTEPLCNDFSDRNLSLCQGRCYTRYEGDGGEDPYRRPCSDKSGCILTIRWCNRNMDCTDGSDELNCPWVVSMDTANTLLLCWAILTSASPVFLFVNHISSKVLGLNFNPPRLLNRTITYAWISLPFLLFLSLFLLTHLLIFPNFLIFFHIIVMDQSSFFQPSVLVNYILFFQISLMDGISLFPLFFLSRLLSYFSHCFIYFLMFLHWILLDQSFHHTFLIFHLSLFSYLSLWDHFSLCLHCRFHHLSVLDHICPPLALFSPLFPSTSLLPTWPLLTPLSPLHS